MKSTDAPDSVEVDALHELEINRGYVLVRKRIEELIELRRDALESCNDPKFNQGFIAGLRTVLEIPEGLRCEILVSMEGNDETKT